MVVLEGPSTDCLAFWYLSPYVTLDKPLPFCVPQLPCLS